MPSLKTIWSFIKRNPKKSIVTSILLYIIMGLITVANSTTGEARDDCEEMTKHFEGGIRLFNGEDYNFIVCGKPFYSRFWSTSDKVRLQVYDAKNELRLERIIDVDWNAGGEGLSFFDKSFFYTGANDDGVVAEEISMPPSRWEWLKVRIKHAFWTVMQNIFLKPIESFLGWIFH